MDKIKEVAAFGGTPYWANGLKLTGGVSGGLELAAVAITNAQDLALGFAEAAAQIDANDTLSAKGKAAKKREAVVARLRKLILPREHAVKVKKDAAAALAKLDAADEEVPAVIMAAI